MDAAGCFVDCNDSAVSCIRARLCQLWKLPWALLISKFVLESDEKKFPQPPESLSNPANLKDNCFKSLYPYTATPTPILITMHCGKFSFSSCALATIAEKQLCKADTTHYAENIALPSLFNFKNSARQSFCLPQGRNFARAKGVKIFFCISSSSSPHQTPFNSITNQ